MNELFEWLVTAEDTCQPAKIKHLLKAIIVIVFFAGLANANEWIAIHLFAPANEEPLRNYLELSGGIPSHDTIQRVLAMAAPEYLQEFRNRWNEIRAGSVGIRSGRYRHWTAKRGGIRGMIGGKRILSSAR